MEPGPAAWGRSQCEEGEEGEGLWGRWGREGVEEGQTWGMMC